MMRAIAVCLLLITGSVLQAKEIKCPAMREGKKLSDAAFFEWMSVSANRTMATDRRALPPDESRLEGEDWFQRWDVSHAVEAGGLQMVCKYLGVKKGLFLEVKNVSVCALTKKAGKVEVVCN
jgi:hypothetical protein